MKEKIKRASFWSSLIGAIFLILGAFGVEVGDDAANTAVNSVCSVLVMLGIVVPDKKISDDRSDVFPDDDEKPE